MPRWRAHDRHKRSGAIVITTFGAAVAIWGGQLLAPYAPVSATLGHDIRLTAIVSGQPEVILANAVEDMEPGSRPLGYRACFTTPLTLAMLSETYVAYPGAEPGPAPGGFDCFDAVAIGAALARGEALAFLSQANIGPDIDRVVAVFPDGRAYAWHQLNPAAKD